MAKSYFAILELTPSATEDDIRSAYRRLAKEYHPDHYAGGSGPFQQIQEAYAVMVDSARRAAYEKKQSGVPLRRSAPHESQPKPEPLIPESEPMDFGGIAPINSFETFSPSMEEISDWLWGDSESIERPKSGRIQNLTLEVTLTREQALRGGTAKVMVPATFVCRTCLGVGRIGTFRCIRCGGEGAVSSEIPIPVTFPAGIKKDHSVIIPLEQFGIGNLHLTVLFRPRDTVMS